MKKIIAFLKSLFSSKAPATYAEIKKQSVEEIYKVEPVALVEPIVEEKPKKAPAKKKKPAAKKKKDGSK